MYRFVFLFIILFFIFLYIKTKYGFWIFQPVFHVYDFSYYLFPPGIIDISLPEKNKFTNFSNIQTVAIETLSSFQWQQIVHFIRRHYLRNAKNKFAPSISNISPDFFGFNSPAMFSIYFTDTFLLTHAQETVTHSIISGLISSRPITITIFHLSKQPTIIAAYYVDYLCVDISKRKKGIAPELIQTHHYNQRHLKKQIQVTVFKREHELTGIVPLCVYSTIGFSMKKWYRPIPELVTGFYKLVKVNTQNFYELAAFISFVAPTFFEILLEADRGNQLELIKTQNVYIQMLLEENKIVAVYFFRKTCVFVDTDLQVLTCFASINQSENNSIFIEGFKLSFWETCELHGFGFAAIENISHNYILIDNLKEKSTPIIESPTAYFFYNFAYKTFLPEQVFIFN